MKRLLSSGALFLCSLLTFAQFSGSGSGTESDPYLILNPIQLNQLRNYLGKSGVYFKLMADIDLTEYLEDENPSQGWQPVGTSSTPFKGILDGNGKTVSGLWINRSSSNYVGFFGNLNGGTVKNLTLKGTSINGSSYVGLLSGNSGTVIDCAFSGKVNGVSNVGGCVGCNGNFTRVLSTVDVSGTENYVGGISGADADINNCTLINNYVRGHNYVGGICGYYNGSGKALTNAYAYTDIEGNNYVGGIAGRIANVKYNSYSRSIIDCGYIGDIIANSYVGGICGEHSSKSEINRCFAVGSIMAGSDYVGGLVGYSDGTYNGLNETIDQSYFSGNIAGGNYIGGIVGKKYMGLISKCYAYATISGTKYVGGVFGDASGYNQDHNFEAISNVANIAYLKSTEGILGRIYGTRGSYAYLGEMGTANENKAYNRAIVISQGVAQDVNDDLQNGTGVSKTTLKLKATYVAMGWNFTDTWAIQETECYPYMQTQTAPPVITSQVVSGATTINGKCIDGGTITLEIDGAKKQLVSTGNTFSFTVDPLQAGHEVRVSAKAEGKEQSYYATEVVSFLGKGTEADPYQVSTAADLSQVYRKGYYKLMNDIDLTSYINKYSPKEGWESIGREGSETIYFDGNGHKVTGLWCNSTRDNTGLFSCFANGTIKNLTVETAKGKQVKGGANTGILIGKMISGTIDNCRVSGSVADGTPVGGIVGLLDGGKILLSQASVTISTSGEDTYVGGLVGDITSGEIDQCVTLGKLTATGKNSQAGGLVGKNAATVTNCYSNVAVASAYCAAGLIAYNYGLVEKCYAIGNLSSMNYGAGVIGYNDGENAVVKNCAAMNQIIDVTYESQAAQGGGYGQRIIGGIKNGAPAPELNNYALKSMQVSLNNVPQKVYDDIMNGVGKNGEDMVKASTYNELGWDFTDKWEIDEGNSYPSLKNNKAAVGKPGEDPNPDPDPEPDPDPIITDDDLLSVSDVTASTGSKVSIGINLTNKTTTLTAYQFDLTLPKGITLAINDKGKYEVTKTSRYEDDTQSLTVEKLATGNIYRFVSFSLSNGVIEGTEGAILNVLLSVDNDLVAGSYDAKIENIVFTNVDGSQLKLQDTQFKVIISDVKKGDANGDGVVNVSDIVEIVNYILGKPSTKFVKAAADISNDGNVNVTDIVQVVSLILSSGKNNARTREADGEKLEDETMRLHLNDDNVMSLSLDNISRFTAAQFDVSLSNGMSIDNLYLNPLDKGHQLSFSEIGDNCYRVIVYSLDNSTFCDESTEVVNIKMSGDGSVGIDNIIFVTQASEEKTFSPTLYSTTGLKATVIDCLQDIYSINGQLIRRQAKGTAGLEKGLYIINGKKVIVK